MPEVTRRDFLRAGAAAGASLPPLSSVAADILGSIVKESDLPAHKGWRAEQVEGVSAKAIEILQEYAEKRGKLHLQDFDEFVFLAENGFNVEQLGDVRKDYLMRLVAGFKNERWPRTLLQNFAEPEAFLTYSNQAAERAPSFRQGRDELLASLNERLDSHEHFNERKPVVASNEHILSLLHQYLDFFEGNNAKKQIPRLFQNENEEGGLFFSGESGFEFLPVPNTASSHGKNPTNTYLDAAIRYYVPTLGQLHTHPFSPTDPKVWARPSGKEKTIPGAYEYSADLGVLRTMTEVCNPHNVDTLVANLGEGRYVAYAYFRDVKPNLPLRETDVTVVEFGVFNYR